MHELLLPVAKSQRQTIYSALIEQQSFGESDGNIVTIRDEICFTRTVSSNTHIDRNTVKLNVCYYLSSYSQHCSITFGFTP